MNSNSKAIEESAGPLGDVHWPNVSGFFALMPFFMFICYGFSGHILGALLGAIAGGLFAAKDERFKFLVTYSRAFRYTFPALVVSGFVVPIIILEMTNRTMDETFMLVVLPSSLIGMVMYLFAPSCKSLYYQAISVWEKTEQNQQINQGQG